MREPDIIPLLAAIVNRSPNCNASCACAFCTVAMARSIAATFDDLSIVAIDSVRILDLQSRAL